MEKVIVTGGAGFIGSHIVDALVGRGYDVHVIDTLYAGKKEYVHEKATLHIVDVRDREALTPLFEGARYVFHEAGLPGVQMSIDLPLETNEVNVIGLLNVLEASRIHGVKRVIFAASSSAYGNQEIMPLTENLPVTPVSPYGVQKYVGEVYCKIWSRVYGIETVSLRYFNVYGPRQSSVGAYASVIARFIDMRAKGEPLTITGDGNQTRDFVHINDVVRANLIAMTHTAVGSGDVINIGNTTSVSVNHIAELIGGEIVHIEPRLEARDSQASIEKAKTILGWEPEVSIEEGIRGLKEFYDIG